MLSRTRRLGDRKQVSRVYRTGKSARSGSLSIKYASNRLAHNRWAVVVSKKVSKSAVRRNRIRRRIYGCLRRYPTGSQHGHDAIISVFADDIARLPAADLERQLDMLLQKAGMP